MSPSFAVTLVKSNSTNYADLGQTILTEAVTNDI